MAVTLFWRVEDLVLDGTHDLSAGGTTFALTGDGSIGTTAARVGTNGFATVNANDFVDLSASSIVNLNEGRYGFWMQAKTSWLTSGGLGGVNLRNSTGGFGNDLIQIRGDSTDELELRLSQQGGSASDLATAGANMSINNWYWIEVGWDFPGNRRQIIARDTSLNELANNEDTSTNLSTFKPTAINQIRFGQSSRTDPLWLDQLIISDDYDVPLHPYALYTSATQLAGVARLARFYEMLRTA